MNRQLFQVALAASLLWTGSWAMADEKEEVRKEVLRRIEIESSRVESLALKKAFSATFYDVTIKIKEGGGSSTSKMLLAKKDGKFVNLESTVTTQKMPGLQSLVSKDFKLKTEADAKVFEEALDKLYPVRSFGSKKKAKAVKKTDNGWAFIRGTFFKDLKGFEVTTDAAGTVTAIGYSLEIKK